MSETHNRPQVEFAGTMQTEEASIALKVLESWLSASDAAVRHKVRLFGEEIAFEDAELYVYAYTSAAADGPRWFLEGHTTAKLDAAITRFERLLALCTEAGFAATFDLSEIDEGGNPVGEEHRVG